MITQRLVRDWRIPTAGLMVLTLLFAGFTLHTHWSAFIQWCLATQITLHRYLVMYLLQLNNHQYSGGLWLLTGAFLYGVLHAVGPGHAGQREVARVKHTGQFFRQPQTQCRIFVEHSRH